jgi:ATP-dependent RNA helicase RhlE
LVFTRTKHGADKIARGLCKAGIKADAIHGNKGQTARQNALSNFKDRSISILVATDIAARGIDVDDLSHVFNFDIPNVAETYVHRIGRSGRAGAKGRAISLCDSEERGDLRDIQKLINMTIPVEESLTFVPQKVEYKAQPAQSNNIVNQPRPGQRGNANSSQRNGGRSGSGQQFSNRNKSSNQGRNQNKRFSSQPA